MRGRLLRVSCVVAILATISYLGIRFTPLGFFLVVFRQNPGSFQPTRFEGIVEHVRAMGIRPGETRQLRLDDLTDPKSLRSLKTGEAFARGQGAGSVWAEATVDGALKVVIETRDLGHAGEYGFAFSDTALSPEPLGDAWFALDLPGRLNLVLPRMQVNDHWWQVVYNLD